ncbi:MAG: hypothetical protein IJW47_00620 [Clostridia bacterium]|nr:hypothetical protein [Clostridia bacterium]
MRRTKRLMLLSCVSLIFITFILTSCRCGTPNPDYEKVYVDESYISVYNPEQHIERLSEIVEEKYAVKDNRSKSLQDYSVNIVYSFDDKPEYFLLELCWGYNDTPENELIYSHMVGIIYRDNYYFTSAYIGSRLDYYPFTKENGKSFYSLSGVLQQGKKLLYSNEKHTYGYVEEDGKVMGTKIDSQYISSGQATLEQYDELQEIRPFNFSSYATRKKQNALIFWNGK